MTIQPAQVEPARDIPRSIQRYTLAAADVVSWVGDLREVAHELATVRIPV